LPRPEVIVAQNDRLPARGILALYALGPCRVNGKAIARDDLLLLHSEAVLAGDWPVIAVRLTGVDLA
jgi:hypothetical protein